METFESRYSEWIEILNYDQTSQYKELEKLVLKFNENFKNEVEKAKNKFNVRLRNAVADKTGLSLTGKAKIINEKELDNKDRAAIPIRVVDKVPASLLKILQKFDDSHIELLLHYRSMQSSVKELKFQLTAYNKFAPYHQKECSRSEIENTILHLERLIKEVETCGILEAIRNLGPDFLGGYFVRENRIELYWLSIGLCNIIYGLPVEEFTLVVLCHELVHGYTHIGFDKDGNNWDTDDFARTDLNIVEGFAEFYTEVICLEYSDQAKNAFDALSPKQPSVYSDYKKWFRHDESHKYEKARRILMNTRTKKIRNYQDFLYDLELVKRDFKR